MKIQKDKTVKVKTSKGIFYVKFVDGEIVSISGRPKERKMKNED
jgi:hypothetical protein